MSKRIDGKSAKEGLMSGRESALREAGVELTIAYDNRGSSIIEDTASDSNFSGYGAYTPITVRADTVIFDADLERHKPRDR